MPHILTSASVLTYVFSASDHWVSCCWPLDEMRRSDGRAMHERPLNAGDVEGREDGVR